MADKRITELTTLTPVDNADWVAVVDVSDTTDGPNGTTKKAARSEFKGDTGNAATATAGSTTTGDPGTDASVTNSGTSSAAVFDFIIPRGDTGETGRNPLTVSATEPTSPQQGDLWYQP